MQRNFRELAGGARTTKSISPPPNFKQIQTRSRSHGSGVAPPLHVVSSATLLRSTHRAKQEARLVRPGRCARVSSNPRTKPTQYMCCSVPRSHLKKVPTAQLHALYMYGLTADDYTTAVLHSLPAAVLLAAEVSRCRSDILFQWNQARRKNGTTFISMMGLSALDLPFN